MKRVPTHRIAYTRRCIFPPDADGPRLVLMGYDTHGREVFGVRCFPRGSGIQWARMAMPTADLKRIRILFERHQKETK